MRKQSAVEVDGGAALRVPERNVYLVRTPKDDFQVDRTVVLNAKVGVGLLLFF